MAYKIDEGRGIIYKLTCRVNGRVYVGGFFSDETNESLMLNKRLAYLAMNALQGKHQNDLNTDIKNYGTSNFDIEILEEINPCTASVLRSTEREWMYELADELGTYMYNKLPKSIVNDETPVYEYKYIEGDYTESLEHDKLLSRNLYVITLDNGDIVEVSGHSNYKEFVSKLPNNKYSVRKILTEDVQEYLSSK